MHAIQSHILKELTLRSRARNRELKPPGIESNHFVYHLKLLRSDGLIEKSGNSYSLTATGKRYVGKLSLKSLKPRIQPKIVTVLIVQDSKGRYIFMNSKRQPFFGKISFPYGKIHLGEVLHDAAQRELREKTGLDAMVTHCGDAYLTVHDEGAVISHMFCHVFYGTGPVGTLTSESKTHSVFWARPEEILPESRVPGFLELNSLRMKRKTHFFAELNM